MLYNFTYRYTYLYLKSYKYVLHIFCHACCAHYTFINIFICIPTTFQEAKTKTLYSYTLDSLSPRQLVGMSVSLSDVGRYVCFVSDNTAPLSVCVSSDIQCFLTQFDVTNA